MLMAAMTENAGSWQGRMAEIDATRGRRSLRLDPKGRAPQRECPADFDVIFVEIGRLACETWYRASRITINRWLKERGAKRLVKQRAAFVAHKRAAGEWMTAQTRMITERPKERATSVPVRDRRRVHPAMANRAAQFLRIVRNGGWIVSPTGNGDWFVGSRRRSAAELVALAEARGFDRRAANLQIRAETKVESPSC